MTHMWPAFRSGIPPRPRRQPLPPCRRLAQPRLQLPCRRLAQPRLQLEPLLQRAGRRPPCREARVTHPHQHQLPTLTHRLVAELPTDVMSAINTVMLCTAHWEEAVLAPVRILGSQRALRRQGVDQDHRWVATVICRGALSRSLRRTRRPHQSHADAATVTAASTRQLYLFTSFVVL